MTLEKKLNKSCPKGNKLHKKPHCYQSSSPQFACPFYKAAGQEINAIRGQKVENAVNGVSF